MPIVLLLAATLFTGTAILAVRTRSARVLALPILLVVGLGAACGSDENAPAAAPAATPGGGGGTITIDDFAFAPETVNASVGDTLTVKNADSVVHTATADDDGGFDTGDIAAGKTATIELDEAGTFSYHCDIHDYMKGTIEVTK